MPVDQRTASAQRSIQYILRQAQAHPHFPFLFFPFSSPCWDSGMRRLRGFSCFSHPTSLFFSGRVERGELPGVAV